MDSVPEGSFPDEFLSPKEITRKDFQVRLRGYDRDEVEALLQMVAADYERLLHLVGSARADRKPYETLGDDIGDLLQLAKDKAERLRQDAEEEAAALRAQARREAEALRTEAKQSVRLLIDDAERRATQVRQTAERRAAELLNEAGRRVQLLLGIEADVGKRLDSLQARLWSLQQEFEASGTVSDAEVAGIAALGSPAIASSEVALDISEESPGIPRETEQTPEESDETPDESDENQGT